MKVGTLTFHNANNYGAVLQAYALTEWLKQNNVEAEVVNYQSRIYKKYKTFRKHLYKRAPYLFAVDLIKYKNKNKRNKNFDAFRERYLPVSSDEYFGEKDFKDITTKYDFFICGSDQIWNPEITKGFDPIYFLDFVKDPKKKIAYAPSVALKSLTEFQIADVSKYLSTYKSLSIREQEAIDMLQPYCSKNISKVCDPVFLLDRNCYDKITSSKYEGEKFAFLYIVGKASKFKNVIANAEKIAKQKGIKLYYLVDGDKTFCRIKGTNVFGCNPSDFLSLIKNAEFVISNSFHATAFSIIFSTQFTTFLKDGTGSRMENLLKSFGLEKRILKKYQKEMQEEIIDYNNLKQSIQNYRESSVDYLLNALGLKVSENLFIDSEIYDIRQKNYNELLDFVEWRKTAYLVRHKEKDVLTMSRSGGIFTALSDWIFSIGGVVYGCRMESPSTAIHQRALTKEERDLFRGSKYIQSEMRDCFLQVKKDLENGLNVLFSGTSCQIAGLLNYLDDVDTSKLYTLDVICHGVPSPKLWKSYLEWMEEKHGGRITNVNFRDKKYGWKVHFETVYMGDRRKTTATFRYLFYRNVFLRPSCYECPFANLRRISDITIGDAWGINKSKSKFNDDKGCSIVMINSEKGKLLFDKSGDNINKEEVDLRKFLQHNLCQPTIKPENREKYWDCYDNEGFAELAKKYGTPRLRRQIYNKLFVLLRR